ncbi:MAG TPA: Na+:solute symporter, partial [Hellea balneolensis]|nr:Na+:solute symporter [Hellea balneolensis]
MAGPLPFSTLDWLIMAGLLLVIVIIGLWASRKAARDSTSFFLGGRHMPWWLLGTSMVATTFATDTPNLVTGLVRENGVAANWGWWAFLITGMVSTFIYAKLWRRTGVVTDIEFYELRYSGKPAAFLRGFRAIYLGVLFNVLVLANVTLAMIKFANVMLGLSPELTVTIVGLVTIILCTSGGLLGVLVTDFFLFILSMIGAIAAAWFAVHHTDVGGLSALMQAPEIADKKSFFPDFSNPDQYIPILLIPLLIQWWSAWYPGSEPGGGGYIAQRMLAAKDEKNATGAILLFNIAHYALRPWPWIIVALASLIVFPDLEALKAAMPHVDPTLVQNDLAYPAMLTFLPAGLLGLVMASITAAYISTASTMLNLGSSYVVNDVYARFVNKNASERAKVRMGRMVIIGMMVASALLALKLESATQSFRLILSVGAGTGLLFFLRWFWLRINAWSEISAMAFSVFVAMGLEFFGPDTLAIWQKFALSVGATTFGWILVTLLTPPTQASTLHRFKTFIQQETAQNGRAIKRGLLTALSATLSVYGIMFATGSLLYGETTPFILYGLLALCSGW